MRKLAMTVAASVLGVCCAAGASEKVSSRFTSDFSILPCADEKYQIQAQIFDRGTLLVSPRFTCSEGKSARIVLVHPNMEISVDVSLPESGSHELVFCSIEVEKKEGRIYAATHTVEELPVANACCAECRAEDFSEEEEVPFVIQEIAFEASPTEAEVVWQFTEEEEIILPASTTSFEEEADELLSPLNWFFASLETDADLS